MSLYHLLGVTLDADAATLRAAYAMALQALPKSRRGRLLAWLGGRSRARLTHAFMVLSDPRRRAAYNRELAMNLLQAQFPPGH